MKSIIGNKIITVIILAVAVLFASTNCSSQTYEELQDIFYYTSKKLDAARDSLVAYKNLDSIISLQKRQLEKDSQVLRNDSILKSGFERKINILSDELKKRDDKPLFEFRGFYTGLSCGYLLDSNLIKNTVWNELKYDITGTLKFNILDKLDLSCGIGVPLRKENIFLKTNIEWRIFK